MDEIEFHLKGKTLQVYWYLLTSDSSIGVRETAKALGFSSPSIAAHHLSKLVDLNLVEKSADNKYVLQKTVKVGVLKHFIEFRGKLLPRYIFVAIFFTTAVLLYGILLLILPVPGAVDRVLFFLFCGIGAIFGWLETLRLYKLRIFRPD